MSGTIHPLTLCRHGLHGASFILFSEGCPKPKVPWFAKTLGVAEFSSHLSFLGAIAKLRKPQSASSCLSVRLPVYLPILPHGTTRLPRDGCS